MRHRCVPGDTHDDGKNGAVEGVAVIMIFARCTAVRISIEEFRSCTADEVISVVPVINSTEG